MKHLSSRKNSIQRGMNHESTATMLVHESRENLYQELNPQNTHLVIINKTESSVK